jgi:hypothetical protein
MDFAHALKSGETWISTQPATPSFQGYPAMRIVNPTFGLASAPPPTTDRSKFDWRRDPIALFGNSKPNAKELLEGLRARMGGMRNLDGIDYLAKKLAGQPAPAEMIDGIAARYRIALLALAD